MRAVILPPRMPRRGKELLRNDKGQKRDLDALPARVTARWRKSLTMVIVRKILLCPQDTLPLTIIDRYLREDNEPRINLR